MPMYTSTTSIFVIYTNLSISPQIISQYLIYYSIISKNTTFLQWIFEQM